MKQIRAELFFSIMVLVWATGTIGQSRSTFGLAAMWPGYLRGEVTCVAVAERYAYIGSTIAGPGGCERGWRGRLELLEISDPARPVWVGGYDFHNPIGQIQAMSNYVYVASGGTLHVLAVTNAAVPMLIGRWNANDDIKSFQLNGTHAYAVRESALDVIDVSNPAPPVRVGSCRDGLWAGAGVRVSDHYAYVAAGGGLRVNGFSM